MNTVIKEYQGTTICVNEDGKFVATIGERKICRTTIAAVEKEILKSTKPVKGFIPDRYADEIEIVMVAAIETKGYRDRYRTPDGQLRNGTVYHWDPELVSKIKDNCKRRKSVLAELDKEFDALLKTACRMSKKSLEPNRAQVPQKTEKGE